jgi:homoaconitase/3-isopropylmalate dehydratase large subunit
MTSKRRIPTKAELVQLQKLYRTDERIGERLGGVPAYLVAYWRRKKNIPKLSQPKYSESEISNLWERYGDDDRCGLELGISKAAFYNWRRRYEIREKPAFLKLEQLELNFPGLKNRSHALSLYGKQTTAQKILARLHPDQKAEVGQPVTVEPDLAVVQCNVHQVIEGFKKKQVEYVWNPAKVVISMATSCETASTDYSHFRGLRHFTKHQRIRTVSELREGDCQQVLVEGGAILPGQLSLGLEPESRASGCLGHLGLVVDINTMGQVWESGQFELEVPPTIRIDISGRRSRGVYARDIVQSVAHRLGATGAEGAVIEFHGSSISQMSISERMTLTGLSDSMGAVSAICAFDSSCRRYLTGRTSNNYVPVVPDKDAVYSAHYQINIDQLTPQITPSGTVTETRAVQELEGVSTDLVILGSGINGRFDDLRAAAEILRGKKIHPECHLLVCPASRATYIEALKKGLIRILVEAGASILAPGCHPSSALVSQAIRPFERCLSTFAPVDESDQSPPDGGEIYYCSPATAAASALNSAITDPTGYGK